MGKIREIKKRIKAVGNIRRITNTMQMIATARFKTAMDRATATKPYTQKVQALVQELAAEAGDVRHPLFDPPDPSPQRNLVLVLTSNRGLCGSYNSNVLRMAMTRLAELGDRAVLEIVGKKGQGFFRFAGWTAAQAHSQFGDKPAFADVEALAERYMSEFASGKYDSVSVIYMKFISTGRQRAVVEQLLPLTPPADDQASESGGGSEGASSSTTRRFVQYDFSPDAESLLAELLPITVKTALYQSFNDAVVSEQVSRMIAMKSATDNATKLGKTLRRTFNRARQAQITTELTEIIGGSAGLD